MKRSWNNRHTDDLARAFLTLKTAAEVKSFFRDLLTEEEIIEFGKRFEVARMLDANIPYTDITKATGLSSTTIARVSRWLRRGKGGYNLVLKRLK